MKDTFLMIDGNSLLHRAFHALPLMDAGGVYTNAIYGFLTMMLKAISDENARYLADVPSHGISRLQSGTRRNAG